MRVWLLKTLAAAALSFGLAAAASALAAETCDPGEAQLRETGTLTGDMAKDMVIGVAVVPSLFSGDYSLSALQKAKDHCDRGTITAGGKTYRLSGHAGGKPARLALPDGEGAVVYLAETGRSGSERARYALIAADSGGSYRLLAYFDALPNDNVLAQIVKAVIERPGNPLVLRDKKGKLNVFINPNTYKPPTPPSSEGELTPNPGAGAGEPTTSLEPQGEIFESLPDGGVRHRLSGVVCPKALKGFRREQLTVYDAAGGGRDVSCRFLGQHSWMTLYMTRLPPRYDGAQVFGLYVKEAQQVAPPVGDEVAAPLATGPRPLPTYGKFWKDSSGRIQGLWLVQIGPWHIKLRLTCEPGDEQAARDFAQGLYELIYSEVNASTT